MNLTRITAEVPATQFSHRLKLARHALTDDARQTGAALVKLAQSVRQAQTADKGLCINLAHTERINENYRKAIVTLVKNVLKHNQIGLDFLVSSNPALEVSILLDEVRGLMEKNPVRSSIRIQPELQKASANNKFSWVFLAAGLLITTLGMFVDKSTLSVKWLAGAPASVGLGALMIVLSALPKVTKYLVTLRKSFQKT